MRKALIALAVLAALGAALVLWWPSDDPGTTAEAPSQPGPPAAHPGDAPGAHAGEATAATTPEPATALTLADGAFAITVNAGGAPHAGARVEAYRRGMRDPNTGATPWTLGGRGVTDDTGSVRVLAAAGEYMLAARAPGFAATRIDAVRPQGEALTTVTLNLAVGVTVSGQTVEKKGGQDAVPLAQLTLTPSSARGFERMASAPPEEVATAQSDPRGAFSFSQVAPGMYLLEARAPGHATARQSVTVTAGTPPLVVPLAAAGYLEGFVRTADGKPAAGAEVSAIGGTELPLVAIAGNEGGFSVEVPPGSWRLSAKRAGFAGGVEGLSVAAGRATRGISVILGPQCAIEGDVQDHAGGKPLASARVDVSPHGFNGDSGRAVTGVDGKFHVEGLAPGDYDVVASAAGYGERNERANVTAGQTFKLSLSLDGAGSVEGTVRDAAGHPMGGVFVVAGGQEARADADGHYRVDGVPAGRTWVRARRDANVAAVGQGTEVKSGETAHLDLTLGETGQLQGHLRSSLGGTLDTRSWRVACASHGRNSSSENLFVTLDADGAFEQELVAGAYSCWATDSHGPAAFKEVTIEAGRIATLELVITDTRGGLQGTVFEPDGSPSAQAAVWLRVGANSYWAQADDDGNFTVGSAGADLNGAAEVYASNGGRVAHQNLEALPAQLSVTLTPAAGLRGRVVSQDGAAVNGFSVSVALKSRRGMRMGGGGGYRPFAGDTFELQDVPADALTVTATTPDGRRGQIDVTPTPGAVSDVAVPVAPFAPPER